MLKTQATREAAEALAGAAANIRAAIGHISSIRRAALTDGWCRQLRTQITRLEGVGKEVDDMCGYIDYEIDDPRTISDNE